jgi:hypothetical protein
MEFYKRMFTSATKTAAVRANRYLYFTRALRLRAAACEARPVYEPSAQSCAFEDLFRLIIHGRVCGMLADGALLCL